MPNRSVLIVVVMLALVAVGGAAIYFSSSAPVPAPSPTPRASASPLPSPSPSASPSASPVAKSTPKPADPLPTPTPEASPTTGTLIIESDVPDTSVFVDQQFLGKAPVTAKDLRPGPHRINMSVTGYEGFVDTIDVAAGTRTFTYSFKEIRLDASIAVNHKHTMGSCTGTLRATPKGLTYETTNKDDGFSTALTDLETFSVDYLEKNLKVKAKGGKTLTFTDAGGNIDRLYLFHREVDKARQRLISGK